MSTKKRNRHEILDRTPVSMPVGFHRPPTLQEQMLRIIRSEQWRAHMEASGQETFEDADDFDVGDDYDPRSPYEQNFDHDLNINALSEAVKRPKAAFKEQTPKATPKPSDKGAPADPGGGEKT